LEGYAATRRKVATVDLDGDYFVRVKKLNRLEVEQAELALSDNLMRQRVGDGESVEASMKMDSSAYRTRMVAISIVEWNLDGPCEALKCPGNHDRWPVDEAHVRAMDSADFMSVWRQVNALNEGRKPAERLAFRAGGERGGDAGDADVAPEPAPLRA